MKKWVILFFFCWCMIGCQHTQEIVNFEGKDIDELKVYVEDYYLELEIEEIYSKEKTGTILKQIPSSGKIEKNENIKVVVSYTFNP